MSNNNRNKIKGIIFIIIGVLLALLGEILVFFFYGDNIGSLAQERRTLIIVGYASEFIGNILQLIGVLIIAKHGIKYFKLAAFVKVLELTLLAIVEIFYFSGSVILQETAKGIDNISPLWEMFFITLVILGCIRATGEKYNKMDKVIILLVIITTIIELFARSYGGYLEKINFYSNSGTLAHCIFVVLVSVEIFIEVTHAIVLFETIKEFKEEQQEIQE